MKLPQIPTAVFPCKEFTFPKIRDAYFFSSAFRLDLSFPFPFHFHLILFFPDELGRECDGRWMMVWDELFLASSEEHVDAGQISLLLFFTSSSPTGFSCLPLRFQ